MTTRAEQADELQGRLVSGRYRLDRLVAGGGMAQVWAGTDAVLNRRVAIKLLRRRLAEDERFVARFRREAVAAARLNHSNIVAIYDTCSEPGIEAIVMELVPGATLRERLDEVGMMAVAEALDICTQVADTLTEAHAAGLVHRDIKPANILLDPSDDEPRCRVVVTDFGIAKAVTAEGDTTDLTRVGTVLGTAKYLAPEQVEGQPVDGRTDVYALGVVLYEALCGRAPFQGDSEVATALARLHTEPRPPRQLRADVPRPVEAIVHRAMARRPDDRYASATDLRTALLAAADTSLELRQLEPAPRPDTTAPQPQAPRPGGPRAPAPARQRSWLMPTVLVIGVAAILAGAGVLLGSRGADLFDGAFGGGDASTSTSAAATTVLATTPVSIAGMDSFDPAGDNDEHDDLLDSLVDQNVDTAWSTEGYTAPDPFPSLKPGVGVILELDEATDLSELNLQSPYSGWQAEVYVADAPAAELAGWGDDPVAFTAEAGETVVDLGGRRGAAVLIWITSVAGQHRTSIGEVELLA